MPETACCANFSSHATAGRCRCRRRKGGKLLRLTNNSLGLQRKLAASSPIVDNRKLCLINAAAARTTLERRRAPAAACRSELIIFGWALSPIRLKSNQGADLSFGLRCELLLFASPLLSPRQAAPRLTLAAASIKLTRRSSRVSSGSRSLR